MKRAILLLIIILILSGFSSCPPAHPQACKCLGLTVKPQELMLGGTDLVIVVPVMVDIEKRADEFKVTLFIPYRAQIMCEKKEGEDCKAQIAIAKRSENWSTTLGGEEHVEEALRHRDIETERGPVEVGPSPCDGEWHKHSNFTIYQTVVTSRNADHEHISGTMEVEFEPKDCGEGLKKWTARIRIDSEKDDNIDHERSDYDGDGKMNSDEPETSMDPDRQ